MPLNGTAGRAIALLIGVLTMSAAACGESGGGEGEVEVVGERCLDADEGQPLKPYSVGRELGGLPLETVLPQCDGRARGDTITYVYGDCGLPKGEGGCATPLQIQIWRACARAYRDYEPANRPALSKRRGRPGCRLWPPDRGLHRFDRRDLRQRHGPRPEGRVRPHAGTARGRSNSRPSCPGARRRPSTASARSAREHAEVQLIVTPPKTRKPRRSGAFVRSG